jgi:hypothetical protein
MAALRLQVAQRWATAAAAGIGRRCRVVAVGAASGVLIGGAYGWTCGVPVVHAEEVQVTKPRKPRTWNEWVKRRAPLPPLDDVALSAVKDQYTEGLTYKCKKPKLACPGRGEGVLDSENIKIIGAVDPSDIVQGRVGDCWLLSAISSLAEFDGAIEHLFRKTEGLKDMPRDGPNQYTITLYDLESWKEVDVIVDERLCTRSDGRKLLGARPSVDGELWVCYLEKALAAHCGGWDKINGGQCTHGWALLTGCQDQYTIFADDDGKYRCAGTYNPNYQRWEALKNSPHDGFQGLWPMDWPDLGGGGIGSMGPRGEYGLDHDDLFARMCLWDQQNYIMAVRDPLCAVGAVCAAFNFWKFCCLQAGTGKGHDRHSTNGIRDGHAYSVLRCVSNVAGSGFDLIQVRNPWGRGEFESGHWNDTGPGWKQVREKQTVFLFFC